jgi:6-phosphogluconate dehydrogenase
MVQDSKKNEDVSLAPRVEEFVRNLDEPHRMLVVLKAQLYGGRWEPMLEDLQNRLEGKPYIFKLANRIKDDIDRIHALQKFEQEKNIDLADYVSLES